MTSKIETDPKIWEHNNWLEFSPSLLKEDSCTSMDLRAHRTSLKYRDTDPKAEAFTHEEGLSGEDIEVKLLIMSFFSVEFLVAADNLFCVKYLYGM